jgi:hypothetical protein
MRADPRNTERQNEGRCRNVFRGEFRKGERHYDHAGRKSRAVDRNAGEGSPTEADRDQSGENLNGNATENGCQNHLSTPSPWAR